VRILNTSHKDITAYNLSVTAKYADGSTNFFESSQDFLPLMGSVANGSEEMRQRFGNGTFAAGTHRDESFPGQLHDITDLTAIVDVVAYADSTADVDNDRAFSHIVAQRKGSVLAMEKVNQLLQSNPDKAAVAKELKRLAEVLRARNISPDDPESYEADHFQEAARHVNETDYATALHDRIAHATPHTQLKAVRP
jgi:hypothetical protein